MLLSSVMAYRSLVEVLAGASTYLVTPPSSPRHHPISAIALHFRSSLQSIHDVFISRLLTVTFTTAAFRTEAAYGCLEPAPTSRLRRAFLHLRHSTVFSEHVLGTTIPWNCCAS